MASRTSSARSSKPLIRQLHKEAASILACRVTRELDFVAARLQEESKVSSRRTHHDRFKTLNSARKYQYNDVHVFAVAVGVAFALTHYFSHVVLHQSKPNICCVCRTKVNYSSKGVSFDYPSVHISAVSQTKLTP